MISRSPSPPLIKGIDGIVSRPPNEVNYSTLNSKNMETRIQPGKEKSRKYKKYERSGNMAKDVKKDENDGKIENVREPGNRNEIEVMKSDLEYDGEEDGATREAQPKKYENPTSNIDTTNDNTCNSCISASRNIDNGKVTNMETKSVPTNDEGNKGEGSETKVEAEF